MSKLSGSRERSNQVLNNKIKFLINVIIIILLLEAKNINSNNYYQLVNTAVSLGAIYNYLTLNLKFKWIFIIITLIFNPIFTPQFSNLIWDVINTITAAIFILPLIKLAQLNN
ncbi:MAG: DUF6804 family protein [Bacillota bacterium]